MNEITKYEDYNSFEIPVVTFKRRYSLFHHYSNILPHWESFVNNKKTLYSIFPCNIEGIRFTLNNSNYLILKKDTYISSKFYKRYKIMVNKNKINSFTLSREFYYLKSLSDAKHELIKIFERPHEYLFSNTYLISK